MAKIKRHDDLSLDITRLTRTIYFFIAVFAVSIVIFDAGNLITREAVIQRWSVLTALLVINTAAWLLSSSSKHVRPVPSIAIGFISASMIIAAGLITYWERGMASSSTILFVLPLLIVALLKNRHALLATATLSASAYSFASVKYFNDFFNEGYRIQLWGNVVLYSGIIFVCTWLIMILTGLRHDSK